MRVSEVHKFDVERVDLCFFMYRRTSLLVNNVSDSLEGFDIKNGHWVVGNVCISSSRENLMFH